MDLNEMKSGDDRAARLLSSRFTADAMDAMADAFEQGKSNVTLSLPVGNSEYSRALMAAVMRALSGGFETLEREEYGDGFSYATAFQRLGLSGLGD
jgi:hypothetical protein